MAEKPKKQEEPQTTASKPGQRVKWEDNVVGGFTGTVISSDGNKALIAQDSPCHAKPVVAVDEDLLEIV